MFLLEAALILLYFQQDQYVVLKSANGPDVHVSLLNENSLSSTVNLNKELPLVILIHAFHDIEKNTMNQIEDELYQAYECRSNYNFLVLRIESNNTGNSEDFDMSYAREHGAVLANALIELIKDYPVEKIHLICK